MMTVAEVLKECRNEAKKHGLTFKKHVSSPAYLYVERESGRIVRTHLTLDLAYEIACSDELKDYAKKKGLYNPTTTKFLKAANAVAKNYDDMPERTSAFCNLVSEYAYKKYKLNANATTYEQNCFIEALDAFFA